MGARAPTHNCPSTACTHGSRCCHRDLIPMLQEGSESPGNNTPSFFIPDGDAFVWEVLLCFVQQGAAPLRLLL